MIKCETITSKYLTWDLGKGEEALFQEDSWDGLPPLDSLNFSPNIKNTLVNLWGNKELGYKQPNNVNGEDYQK